ncbi:unnamed protein product [Ectocarpus sp. 13 AM-2016]
MAELATTLLPMAWDASRKAYNLAKSSMSGEWSFPGNPRRARKILVAGLAGSGKTSVINSLTGLNLETGDSSQGVTFHCSAVPERIYRKEHSGEPVKLVFMDTVGFDSGPGGALGDGALHRDMAFTSMMKLLRATSELDVIIYVMQKGRLTTGDMTCYELLVKKVAHGLRRSDGVIDQKIPVILVITKCETRPSGNLQNWLGERAASVPVPGVEMVVNGTNHQVLNNAGMDTSRILCTAFFGDDHFAAGSLDGIACRNDSVRNLLQYIVGCSDDGPFLAAHPGNFFRETNVLKYMWSPSYRKNNKDKFLKYLKGVFPREDAEKIFAQVIDYKK